MNLPRIKCCWSKRPEHVELCSWWKIIIRTVNWSIYSSSSVNIALFTWKKHLIVICLWLLKKTPKIYSCNHVKMNQLQILLSLHTNKQKRKLCTSQMEATFLFSITFNYIAGIFVVQLVNYSVWSRWIH